MRFRSVISALIVAFLMVIASVRVYAMPGVQEPKPLSGWESAAFKEFQNDAYDKAAKTVEAHKNERFAKILSAFIHQQQYVFTNSKVEKAAWKGELKNLKNSVGVDDIHYLSLIAQEKDKPHASKEAKKLLKRCFKNINQNKDVPSLVYYLSVPDEDVNSYAMGTLKDILKHRRAVVKEGGSLRSEDIQMMKDKALNAQLTAIVAQQDVEGLKAAYPKGVSKAIDCLVYIEEPALEHLEKVSTLSTAKAKEKVQKAVIKRTTKFPKSNWYSAVGKPRS